MRISSALIAMLCFAVPGWAQAPKGEVFGGFSTLYDQEAIYGWQASVAYNPHSKVGLLADFAGLYVDDLRFHQFLFGPRFNARLGRVNPFAHALVGFERATSDTNFAMGFGGGLDVKVGGPVLIRVAQLDWIPIKYTQWNTSTVRFGIGVVIAFGQ